MKGIMSSVFFRRTRARFPIYIPRSLYGNINTADSLTAMKKLLYEDRRITSDELLRALDADFDGYETIRRLLKAAPKYGNDDPEADAMACRVHEQVCRCARDQAPQAGLDSYLVVVINNSANTVLGRLTAASPDGRKAGLHMANANNPFDGSDRRGLTAMLNSLVKLRPGYPCRYGAEHEIFAGTVYSGRGYRKKSDQDLL